MTTRSTLATLGLALAGGVALLVFLATRDEPRAPVAVEQAAAGAAPRPPVVERVEAAAAVEPGASADGVHEPERAPLPDQPGPATVEVRVVAREGGRPLEDVGVRVFHRDRLVAAKRVRTGAGARTEGDARSEAGEQPDAPLVTGSDGVVAFEVPAMLPLRVRAAGRGESAGEASVDVRPLAPGARERVEIALETAWTRVFFGRVLSAVEDAPLEDVLVSVEEGAHVFEDGELVERGRRILETRTGADGLFELRVPAWKPSAARLEARARSLALVPLVEGHETPDRAQVVRLDPSAALVVRLSRGSGPIAGLVVDVTTPALALVEREHRMHAHSLSYSWRATTDASGVARLDGLPARRWLDLTVREGGRALLFEREPLSLAPWETRTVEIALHEGRTVRGRVLENGAALAGARVWLLAPGGGAVRHLSATDRPAETAESGADGRFAFADVLPGRWWVGLAPADFDEPEALLSLPAEVEVIAGVDPREVVLEAARGATISGRVLDPAGEPAGQRLVFASSREPFLFRTAASQDDGSFAIGPLPPGVYELGAADASGDAAPAEAISVRAGARDVVLRLRAGGVIEGTVVDATTRATCEGEITLAVTIEGRCGEYADRTREGRFRHGGLLPGTYALLASTEDGRAGFVRGVELAGGAVRSGIEVAVRPGAKLRLLGASATDDATYEVACEGTTVACGTLGPGAAQIVALPAGALTLRTTAAGRSAEQEIVLTAGEERAVALGGG